MNSGLVFTLAFGIGIIAGLRALTAPATVCWGAWLKWYSLQDSPMHFMSTTVATCIFTILALVELVTDKLPSTPNRTVPMQLGARIVTGGLSGATLSAGGGQSLIVGAVIGAIGALAGTFAGFHLRRGLSQGVPPLVAALLEDAIAVGGGFFIVSRM
jgi:uncharacterized membrane protein